MPQPSRRRKLKVGLLSQHPLVLEGFQRSLEDLDNQLISHTLAPAALNADEIRVPRAAVYVVDAHSPRPAVEALVAAIRKRYREASLIFVGEKFDQRTAFALLRLGAKALLSYPEVHKQLRLALKTVTAGGFWVPRNLLSKFVDSILQSRHHRAPAVWSARLSARELQVLDPVLDNLSYKEIANKLKISERTVKFHVSNILGKFGVRRRADLVLLMYQQNRG